MFSVGNFREPEDLTEGEVAIEPDGNIVRPERKSEDSEKDWDCSRDLNKPSPFEKSMANFVAGFIVSGFRLALSVFRTVFQILSSWASS